MKKTRMGLLAVLALCACDGFVDHNDPDGAVVVDGGTGNPDAGISTACGLVAACTANASCVAGNTCVCNSGFTPSGTTCVAITPPPDAGSPVDGGSTACGLVAACSTNAHCENSVCLCNAGFTPVGNVCVAQTTGCGLVASCASNSHCEFTQCVCNDGFVLSGNACVPTVAPDGGICTDGRCAVKAARVEVSRTAANQGFTAAGGWKLALFNCQGVRVVGDDSVKLDVACDGYYWLTDQRSSSDERAPLACQTATDAGLKIELVYSDSSRVDVSSNVKATFDSDARNGRRKWQIWFKRSEQPTSCL